MSLVNQNARGLGLLGRSGIIKKPKKPQTTVIIALIIKSQLGLPLDPGLSEGRTHLPPSSKSMSSFKSISDGNLQSARHHAANCLTRVIKTHALGKFGRCVPMHFTMSVYYPRGIEVCRI